MSESILSTTLGRFRLIAIIEGISYLVLLFIAMPLKYMADMPMAVKITGSVHGFLFVVFMVFLLLARVQYKWSFGKATLAFLSSLIPFGTFVFDRKIKNDAH